MTLARMSRSRAVSGWPVGPPRAISRMSEADSAICLFGTRQGDDRVPPARSRAAWKLPRCATQGYARLTGTGETLAVRFANRASKVTNRSADALLARCTASAKSRPCSVSASAVATAVGSSVETFGTRLHALCDRAAHVGDTALRATIPGAPDDVFQPGDRKRAHRAQQHTLRHGLDDELRACGPFAGIAYGLGQNQLAFGRETCHFITRQ